MWGIDELEDLGKDGIGAVEDLAKALGDAAEDVGGFLTDTAQVVYHGIAEIEDAFDGALEWLGDTLESAEKDFLDWLDKHAHDVIDFVKRVEDAIDAALDKIDHALKKAMAILADVTSGAIDALGAVYQWVHDALPDPIQWVLDEAVPFVWAAAKLVAAFLLLLAMWPAALAAVLICSLVTTVYGKEQGTVFKHILEGTHRYKQMFKTARLPASGKYFIASDLHHYPGGEMDDSAVQGTKDLYRKVIEHYAADGYHVIENGDVEDYWLRGGTLYGKIFDIASQLPAPYLDRAYAEAQRVTAATYHLHAIRKQNVTLYNWLGTLHDQGRYTRTIGNHDDVYNHPKMVEALRTFYRGIEVYDYVVMEHEGRGVGIIGHGHQADAWNVPACSFLGKATTSLGSAVRDISFGQWAVGRAKPAQGWEVWEGQWKNAMDVLNPWLGTNSDLGNLDEVRLFRSMKKVLKVRTSIVHEGPIVIFSHTHVPLVQPNEPDSDNWWARYYNTGCGIFHRMITGVEWDGSNDPANPRINLVAWRYSADLRENAGDGVEHRYIFKPANPPVPQPPFHNH